MADIREKDLSEVWLEQRFTGPLRTEAGERLRVIYPGRRNDDRGGDFCDAIIAFPDRTLSGDVELHVDSADWRGHGHHMDPAYNSVILHVVYSPTSPTTTLQNGVMVPVLALRGIAAPPGSGICRTEGEAMPCRQGAAALGDTATGDTLDLFGEQRFTRKSADFRIEITSHGPGQALYQGIMRALGYSRNGEAFVELSRRLPFRVLEEILSEGGAEDSLRQRIETLMRQVSGLGVASSWPGDSWLFHSYHLMAMSPSAWNNFRARPGNSPLCRMAAISHLLVRYRGKGLVNSLLGAVGDTGGRKDPGALQVALGACPAIQADGFVDPGWDAGM
jgi:hypothetical protein